MSDVAPLGLLFFMKRIKRNPIVLPMDNGVKWHWFSFKFSFYEFTHNLQVEFTTEYFKMLNLIMFMFIRCDLHNPWRCLNHLSPLELRYNIDLIDLSFSFLLNNFRFTGNFDIRQDIYGYQSIQWVPRTNFKNNPILQSSIDEHSAWVTLKRKTDCKFSLYSSVQDMYDCLL